MAQLADSERTIWKLIDQNRKLAGECERLKVVLSILLRHAVDAQTVITAEEMTGFSPGTVLHTVNQPDGGLRLWVTP